MSTYIHYKNKYDYDKDLLTQKINELFVEMRAGNMNLFPNYKPKIIEFLYSFDKIRENPDDYQNIRRLK